MRGWLEMSAEALNVTSFTKGFIAHLVELGETAIYPKSTEDRRGFRSVIEALAAEIDRLRPSTDSEGRALYRALVLLRNELQASPTGAFDAMETALRNLQLSLTNCPNPFYEEISFTVSPPFAQALLKEIPDRQRSVVMKAAEAFLRTKRLAAQQ